jgi:hypothetical protein
MIKIGWASRDVSTNAPVHIPGQFYRRISTGCMDAITVTALVIEREDTVIMVSGDFVSAGYGIIDDIRSAVSERCPEIPTRNILYSVTHTHSSPRYFTSPIGYDDDPSDTPIEDPAIYRAFLVENISSAIIEAYEKRAEGSFAYGYGTAGIGVSRRSTYFDDVSLRENGKKNSLTPNGHAKMYGATKDDMFSGYEGSTDFNVGFVFTFDKNDELTGAIINVACPSQCGENELYLSADYWHYAREFIRKKYGNVYILPQCAAAGDLSPHVLHQVDALNRRLLLKYGECEELMKIYNASIYKERFLAKVDLGERIFAAFDEVYAWASKERFSDVPVLHSVSDVPLEAWKITREQYEESVRGYDEYARDAEDQVNHAGKSVKGAILSRYKATIDRYEKDVDYYPTEVHTVRLGDVAFASNPFELYVDYQHRIQGRSPFTETFIVQLAATPQGRAAGYLCTERAKENMGYSAIIYSCNVSPEGGQTLVYKTLEELNKLKC